MAYDQWFQKFTSEPKFKENIVKSIEKTGAPLEFRSGKKLTQMGYYCTHGYYSDKENDEEISREIDLVAHKKFLEVNTSYGLKIFVNLKIIADCKFNPEMDLLVFRLEDEVRPNTSVRFPVFTNGTTPIYRILENTMMVEDCRKLFDIPEVSRRIVDVKYQSGQELKRLDKKIEIESNLFHFSEQVLSALIHYFNRDLLFVKQCYERVYETYLRSIEEQKLKAITTPPIMDKVIDETAEVFNVGFLNREFLTVNVFIPIVIVSENTGLLNVIQNASNSYIIDDLQEIKWCMYLYAPSRPIKYSEILEKRYEQPIIICNAKYLEECINKIEIAINDLIKEMENNLNRHQGRIVQEILKIIHHIQ